MKKELLALLLIPALLLTGCKGNTLKYTYDKDAAYSRPEQEPTMDISVDNTTPVDPENDPIDIHFIVEKCFYRTCITSLPTFPQILASLIFGKPKPAPVQYTSGPARWASPDLL